MVSVELQRAEAARMNAKVTVLHASHMSLLSQPGNVVTVIEEAVEAVTAGPFRRGDSHRSDDNKTNIAKS